MNQRVAMRREEVLAGTLIFIYEFTNENHFPPTLREILTGAKFHQDGGRIFWTTSHVHDVLQALLRAGHITMRQSASRTLVITNSGLDWLRERSALNVEHEPA